MPVPVPVLVAVIEIVFGRAGFDDELIGSVSGDPNPVSVGGVTWRGTLGGVVGAWSVGLAGLAATGSTALLVFAILYGSAGMLLDSLLGATLQGRFRCDACAVATERRVHRCGAPTRRVAGLRWLSNDAINAITTVVTTAAGAAESALRTTMTYYQG